jgi:hypothetical protein
VNIIILRELNCNLIKKDMQYKFIVEIVNSDMDILKESKIKVEGKSELEAKMKAKKLILKKYPKYEDVQIELRPPLTKEEKKQLPIQRIIDYLQKQILLTRDAKLYKTASQKKYAEHRRVAYKLALLECRRALKEEKKLIGK